MRFYLEPKPVLPEEPRVVLLRAAVPQSALGGFLPGRAIGPRGGCGSLGAGFTKIKIKLLGKVEEEEYF